MPRLEGVCRNFGTTGCQFGLYAVDKGYTGSWVWPLEIRIHPHEVVLKEILWYAQWEVYISTPAGSSMKSFKSRRFQVCKEHHELLYHDWQQVMRDEVELSKACDRYYERNELHY